MKQRGRLARGVANALGMALMQMVLVQSAAAETVRDVRKKMGSRFELTAVHEDAARAQLALDRAYLEIDRIEAMISSWRPTSVTSEINRQAGVRAVPVPA
ncbi:MAG: FAD:protein FMN transferase, partial [bacterium]|nr:FAD:protein FMN transferase [bacterium]